MSGDLQQRQTSAGAVWALRLAFAAAAPGAVAGLLGDAANFTITRQLQMALYLPAVILGAAAWCRGRSFARSAPVVICVLVTWIGYVYASPRTPAGLEFIAQVTIVLPIAALVVETGAWMLCARTFLWANVAVCVGVFLFEFERHGMNLFLGLHRFGLIYAQMQNRMIANPNVLGGQFAFAAVLALAVNLRAGSLIAGKNPGPRPRQISLAWSILFAVICLLTGSRSASVAALAGCGAIAIGELRIQRPSRVRDLILSSLLAASVLVMLVSFDVKLPLQSIQSRWGNINSVVALGQRVPIWEDAYRAWQAEPMRVVFGIGTGAADKVLGQFSASAMIAEDGTPYRATHSTYIEWVLTFGLFGMLPGVYLLFAMARRARQLDRRDGGFFRQAIFGSVCVWGLATPVILHPCSMVVGSLILAMLSERPKNGRGAAAGSRESCRGRTPWRPVGDKKAAIGNSRAATEGGPYSNGRSQHATTTLACFKERSV